MPAAPAEYSGGPIPRPGTATAAAVLAFVQAGITAIPGVLQLIGAFGATGAEGSLVVETLIVSIVTLIGVGMLIAGAVQLLGGKGRTVLVIGAAIELAICVYYIITALMVSSDADLEAVESAIDVAKGVLVGFAIFFAIMPAVSLILSLGSTTTQFLQSRRGH
jgi:hypothetical protein